MAASCFKAAGNMGYFDWAQGRNFEEESRDTENAREAFRRSAQSFFEKADYEHTLDLLSMVMEYPPWNSEDDPIYDISLKECPSRLPRDKTIRFALARNKWNEITLDDLKDMNSAPYFLPFRENAELATLLKNASEQDLLEIEYSLPLLAADCYHQKGNYLSAIKLYLQSDPSEQDVALAELSTNSLIGMSEPSSTSLDEIAHLWIRLNGKKATELVSKNSDAFLLLRLYEDPVAVAKSMRGAEATRKFSPDVIVSAFEHSKTNKEELHGFGRDQFQADIDQALRNKYKGNLIEAVQWYLHRDDRAHAEQLATTNISNWSKEDLIAIVRRKVYPDGLAEAADEKDTLVSACSYSACSMLVFWSQLNSE